MTLVIPKTRRIRACKTMMFLVLRNIIVLQALTRPVLGITNVKQALTRLVLRNINVLQALTRPVLGITSYVLVFLMFNDLR
jgi:hypothetical protein